MGVLGNTSTLVIPHHRVESSHLSNRIGVNNLSLTHSLWSMVCVCVCRAAYQHQRSSQVSIHHRLVHSNAIDAVSGKGNAAVSHQASRLCVCRETQSTKRWREKGKREKQGKRETGERNRRKSGRDRESV